MNSAKTISATDRPGGRFGIPSFTSWANRVGSGCKIRDRDLQPCSNLASIGDLVRQRGRVAVSDAGPLLWGSLFGKIMIDSRSVQELRVRIGFVGAVEATGPGKGAINFRRAFTELDPDAIGPLVITGARTGIEGCGT